jgi:hypothetical protein
VLDGGGWLAPRPGRFTHRKESRYPLYRRLGGPQGRSGQVRKISPPQGFDPQIVQPVASRYTDRDIATHHTPRSQLRWHYVVILETHRIWQLKVGGGGGGLIVDFILKMASDPKALQVSKCGDLSLQPKSQ